jgi:hypothetical protein
VIDPDTYRYLQDVIRREGRSFLQYAGESFPWSTPEEKTKAAELKQLVCEEREGAASLSRYLVKHRLTPPYLGAYPSYFTSYNYLSLDRLLPLLVEHQKQGLAGLEADLTVLKDGDSHKQVEAIVTMKKRHLKALEALVNTR